MKSRILIFILLIGGLFYYFKIYRNNESFKQSNRNVLGLENQRQTQNDIEQKAHTLIQNTANMLSTTTAQIASSASDFIVNKTVDSVVNQVNKLPPQDQEIIKDKLCK